MQDPTVSMRPESPACSGFWDLIYPINGSVWMVQWLSPKSLGSLFWRTKNSYAFPRNPQFPLTSDVGQVADRGYAWGQPGTLKTVCASVQPSLTLSSLQGGGPQSGIFSGAALKTRCFPGSEAVSLNAGLNFPAGCCFGEEGGPARNGGIPNFQNVLTTCST